jgi:hypothetical protein
MNRRITLLVTILLVSFTHRVFAQKDRKLTNGFSINLNVGIPSDHYGVPKDNNISEMYMLGSFWGLQLGNRWYFSPKEQYGIGLMVNWIDITAGVKAGSGSNFDYARSVADVSFFEIGPLGTYILTKDIALDAYYNLRPSGFATVLLKSYSDGDIITTYAGFGFTHALGAAFRWKALNIGLEYVMGSVNCEGTYSDSYDEKTLAERKNVANNFRIMIGAKF